MLPFFALLVALGLLDLSRSAGTPVLVAALVLAASSAEVAWGWHKTAPLYRGRARNASRGARGSGRDWLARTARPDDVLFGYDPLYLGAWERDRAAVSRTTVIPRADPKLALRSLREAPTPLGRGVWVFDASDTNNFTQKLTIPLRYPTTPG